VIHDHNMQPFGCLSRGFTGRLMCAIQDQFKRNFGMLKHYSQQGIPTH
jgi:hypothetical protein